MKHAVACVAFAIAILSTACSYTGKLVERKGLLPEGAPRGYAEFSMAENSASWSALISLPVPAGRDLSFSEAWQMSAAINWWDDGTSDRARFPASPGTQTFEVSLLGAVTQKFDVHVPITEGMVTPVQLKWVVLSRTGLQIVTVRYDLKSEFLPMVPYSPVLKK